MSQPEAAHKLSSRDSKKPFYKWITGIFFILEPTPKLKKRPEIENRRFLNWSGEWKSRIHSSTTLHLLTYLYFHSSKQTKKTHQKNPTTRKSPPPQPTSPIIIKKKSNPNNHQFKQNLLVA